MREFSKFDAPSSPQYWQRYWSRFRTRRPSSDVIGLAKPVKPNILPIGPSDLYPRSTRHYAPNSPQREANFGRRL